MIVDTSAVLSILYQEPDAQLFADVIASADIRLISAANLLEAGIVIDSQLGAAAGRQLDVFAERSQLQIEPVTAEQVRIARQAYLDYGKGNHPAGLNFGDCFAYALAKEKGQSLLFKGNDFARTDVEAVPLARITHT